MTYFVWRVTSWKTRPSLFPQSRRDAAPIASLFWRVRACRRLRPLQMHCTHTRYLMQLLSAPLSWKFKHLLGGASLCARWYFWPNLCARGSLQSRRVVLTPLGSGCTLVPWLDLLNACGAAFAPLEAAKFIIHTCGARKMRSNGDDQRVRDYSHRLGEFICMTLSI